MKTLIFRLTVLIVVILTTNLQAQEDLKIKNSSGAILMEVREEGVVVTKLSTTERIAFASNLSTDDSGILVYDTDTQSFWVWKSTQWEAIGSTDNLGDHTATQNINLGSFVLSPDGGDDG